MRTGRTNSCTSRPAAASPRSSPRYWPITIPSRRAEKRSAFPRTQRQATMEVLVEEAIMAQLVGGDTAADLLQYRLGRRLAQRAVIGAGADLDDAAGDHLARARAAARPVAVEIDPEALLEPAEGSLEIESGIGQCRPTGQGPAVLDLLLAPAPRGFLKLG